MTHDERTAKLAELYAKAEELAAAWNTANFEKKYDEAITADTELEKVIGEYTSEARIQCFEICRESADPMLKAVQLMTYDTIAVKDEDGDDGVTIRHIVGKTRPIDLQKLHKHVPGGIGYDKQWLYVAEKMNFLLTAQKAKDLGIDPKAVNDSYEMATISAAIDMGKSPTSKTNLLKTLQQAIAAMIGPDYKAVSHDVNYLLSVYSKRNNRKSLSVTCANHRNFRIYLMDVCHRIVTNGSYSVDFKAKKEA